MPVPVTGFDLSNPLPRSPSYWYEWHQGQDKGYVGGQVSNQAGGPLGFQRISPLALDLKTYATFPLASGSFTSTSAGDLNIRRTYGSGTGRNDTKGYIISGYNQLAPTIPNDESSSKTRESYPFSADAPATLLSDLAVGGGGYGGTGTSAKGSYNIYYSGGYAYDYSACLDTIQKFNAPTEGSVSLVGTLSRKKHLGSGHYTADQGYSVGGTDFYTYTWTQIDAFPFASEKPRSGTVGDTTAGIYFGPMGHSSSQYAYISGGGSYTGLEPDGQFGPNAEQTPRNTIDRFPFANENLFSNVGRLTVKQQFNGNPVNHPSSVPGGYYYKNAVSGTTHGWFGGGSRVEPPAGPPTANQAISTETSNFPFAADGFGEATSIGDLQAIHAYFQTQGVGK